MFKFDQGATAHLWFLSPAMTVCPDNFPTCHDEDEKIKNGAMACVEVTLTIERVY
jgi:hypothetical protein